MKLYQNPVSPNSRRATMTAKLLDLPVEMVTVDLFKGENRTPEYLKINPMGKVPTLVDGDLALWESNAIMQYLADKKPGNTLFPNDAKARADVNRWQFWAASHWGPAVGMIVFERLLKKRVGGGDADPTILAYGEREVARFGKTLDDRLAQNDYVCGKSLTLADLAIATPLTYAAAAKVQVESFANLQRWFGKIQDLAVWKATQPPM